MLNRNSYLSVIKFIFLNLGFDAMIHVIVILVTWDMVKVVYNSKIVIEEEEFVEVVSKKPAQVKKKEVVKQKVVKVPKIVPFCRKEKRRRRLERMCVNAMGRLTMDAFTLHDGKKILGECDRRLIISFHVWVDGKISICTVGYDKKLKITKNRGIKAWNKKAMDLLWFRENEYDDLCEAFANVCTNKYE